MRQLPDISADLQAKLQHLEQILTSLALDDALALAYSGGLDSRFLARFSRQLGLRPLLLHISGPHLSKAETQAVLDQAEQGGLNLRIIEFNPLNLVELQNNPVDRCYHCKKQIMTLLGHVAQGLPLCDGSNLSDSRGYRPGLTALQELGVSSPLLLAGLEKSEIRQAGTAIGLPNPEQPASPCLLTRFPYQTLLGPDLLSKVEELEALAGQVLQSARPEAPLPAFRVRLVDGLWELHLPRSMQSELQQPELTEDLRRLSGNSLVCTRFLENLSGFFDA